MAAGHLARVSYFQRLFLQTSQSCHTGQAFFPNVQHYRSVFVLPTTTAVSIQVRSRALHLSNGLRVKESEHEQLKGQVDATNISTTKPSGPQAIKPASQNKSFSVLKYIKKSIPLSVKLDVPIGKFSTGTVKDMGKNLGFTTGQRDDQENLTIEIRLKEILACGFILGLLIYMSRGRNEAKEHLMMTLDAEKTKMIQKLPSLSTTLVQAQPAVLKVQPITSKEEGSGDANITSENAAVPLNSTVNVNLQPQDDPLVINFQTVNETFDLDVNSSEKEGKLHITPCKDDSDTDSSTTENVMNMSDPADKANEQVETVNTTNTSSSQQSKKKKEVVIESQHMKAPQYLLDKLNISKINFNN